MVSGPLSTNGASTTVAALDIFEDDASEAEAVAAPPAEETPAQEPDEAAAAPPEPEIEIVDDDEEEGAAEPPAEQPAAEQSAEPSEEDEAAWKREFRKSFARNFSAKVRKALAGEVPYDQLNNSERRAYQELDSWRRQVEQPVRQSTEERVWAEYQEMWQAQYQNPQRFNELWRDDARRSAWLQMEQNRATLGLEPSIDPHSFRQAFHEYNARFQEQPGAGTEADDFYEDIQETRTWRDMEESERESLKPDNFSGTPQQRQLQMARVLGRIEAQVALRRKQRPAAERVAEVNKTAANAQKAAQTTPPGVPRGAPVRMTAKEITRLASQGDPQGMRLYEELKKRRKAAS